MSANLIVSGPFDVPFTVSPAKIKCIDTPQARLFWQKTETAAFQLKQGIYIFATRAGKGYRPVYVGKATKAFKSECFTHHKLHHYAQALSNGEKGSPVMFFIALPGKVNKIPKKVIGEVEDLMIQFAAAKNPNLRNKIGTAAADWSIKGVVRGGKGAKTKAASAFTTMMGITKSLAT
ncbi:hypothetical protein ACQZ32_25670 [Ralstonia pseudosolanacearum]|uniref:hypothetical protein n=1 Tax=Ralstonia pseudosolanacearum TaxID=1310165 RepID=UPI0012DAD46C|nr:hypothetical protein [Ralstonia pseudosolanacearum]MDC6295462.1 hypothetical protein [Ralstonia pseudosolanacearum]MDD7792582.1 hypothetical protein [Ralstonia pseudosolanacearum]MDN3370597.1 hypothetical protein [Ralstonia pseudosolanacearum]QOK85485.1 hypothetical protein HF907_01885 [Ralstonia pseudosolanacearum]